MNAYQTVLTGTDFTAISEAGAAEGIQLAKRLGAKRVHKVHVVDHAVFEPVLAPMAAEAERAILQEAQDELLNTHREVEGLTMSYQTLVGTPARAMSEVARTLPADLIVMSSHGRGGFSKLMLGSVASGLVRCAPCPVLISGPERPLPQKTQTVLAAIDRSEVSSRVLEQALAFSRLEKARLVVLSLLESGLSFTDAQKAEAENEVRAQIERMLAAFAPLEVDVQIEVMSRAPAAQVIKEVTALMGAGLCVVGTSGRGFWHRMIVGSTATKVLAESAVPVLVVPYDVREAPHEQPTYSVTQTFGAAAGS